MPKNIYKVFLIFTFVAGGFFLASLAAMPVNAGACSPQTLRCRSGSPGSYTYWDCNGCAESNCCQPNEMDFCISGCGGGGGGGGGGPVPGQCGDAVLNTGEQCDWPAGHAWTWPWEVRYPLNGFQMCNACNIIFCTTTTPGSVTLVAPADNAELSTNGFLANWSFAGGWGNGCPANPIFYVQLQLNCAGAWTAGPITNSTTTQVQVSNLNWDSTYCWRVVRHNGSAATISQVWRVRTPPRPVITNQGFLDPLRCNGTRISGRAGAGPNVNNPFTYSFRLSHPRNNFAAGQNFLKEAYFGIVPTVPYNAATYTSTYLNGVAHAHAVFRVSGLDTGTRVYEALNTGTAPYFSGGATSGDLTNASGKATLMGLGVNTRVTQIDNTTLEITFVVRLNPTFTNGNLNVYLMGTSAYPTGGGVVSQAGTATDPLTYGRFDAWRFDGNPPTATVNPFVPVTADRFNTYFYYADNTAPSTESGVLRFSAYCYQESGIPTIIRNVSQAFNINDPGSKLEFPDAANCGFTAASNGVMRQYQFTIDPNLDPYVFDLYVEDRACNISLGTAGMPRPDPWLVTVGGNSSANGGFSDFAPASGSFTGLITGFGDDSYASTYGLLSGTTSGPAARSSKNLFDLRSYINQQVNPGVTTSTTNWFDYTREVVKKNATAPAVTGTPPAGVTAGTADGPIAVRTTNNNLSGNLSAALGIPANTLALVELRPASGNVINLGQPNAGNVTCNGDYIFWVRGNLNIHPAVITNPTTRCIFIVQGDIEVFPGRVSTPPATPITGNVQYDPINALLITNGTFITRVDQPAGGTVPDGLLVRGGVIAKNVTLARNLGLVKSAIFPAEIFQYDPVIIERFRNILALREFSLRER